MAKIHLLDEATINQIAAGEVIENPASCVKELVENSIDAGAKNIFVKIQGGGELGITVTDDGCGMSKEDSSFAFRRHATSKILQFTDLYQLQSFGFRGEALSSISAVAEVSMLTCEKNSKEMVQEGTALLIRGGEELSCSATSCLPGTTIEVRKLFFNVPARKKFLKDPHRNNYDIIKAMTGVALSCPEIAFELIIDEKREFQLSPGTLEDRIRALLGKDFAQSLIKIGEEKEGMELYGFISKAPLSRPNRTGQYFFAGGRPVFSLMASLAVKEGYGTALEPSRHPLFVLFLKTPSDSIDVNVHPQKKEVRFRKEGEVRSFITDVISGALFGSYEEKMERPAPCLPPSVAFLPPIRSTAPEIYVEEERRDSPQPYIVQKSPQIVSEVPFHVIGTFREYIFLEKMEKGEAHFSIDGLIVCNCTLALSRIAFEDLLEPKSHHISSQRLLMPFFIELAKHEANHFEKAAPFLKNLGFDIRPFGHSAFLVEAIPSDFEISGLEDFIHDVVKEEEEDPAKIVRRLAELSSIRRGKKALSIELSREIVGRLLECKDPWHCPFGKKTFCSFSKEELEKKFSL
jgi:DNA mismatch repair protein MutL